MSEPEPRAASTTTVPKASPETMRLRRGKSRPRGSHSIGISDTTAPVSTIRSISGTASPGYGLPWPPASTPTAPVSRLATWARWSIPRAKPETTT